MIISHLETAAILESASPRNPRLFIEIRSLSLTIFEVACLKKAVFTSFESIPQPLSVILIRSIPPFFISTVMEELPASIEFSKSSFTIDAGLSTTSPAAILSIVPLSSILIINLYPVLYLIL